MSLLVVSLLVIIVILSGLLIRAFVVNKAYLEIIDTNEKEIDVLVEKINKQNNQMSSIWNSLQKVNKELNEDTTFYYEKNPKVAKFFSFISNSIAEIDKTYNSIRLGEPIKND